MANGWRQILARGAQYFALVYAAGWIMGPIRVLVLEPRLGPLGALAIETPLMLAVVVAAAAWIVRLPMREGRPNLRERAGIGATGLALLLSAEFLAAHLMRGLSFPDWLAQFATPPGVISLTAFLLFGAMPALLGRR